VLSFGFGGDGTHEFLPHNYVPNTIVYTTTHDTDTFVGWWKTASAHEKHLAGTYLACQDSDVHWAAIRACLQSVSRLAVFPMQDVLGLASEHRMNSPGSLGAHNWSWRITPSMLREDDARVLRLMSEVSGR
jgi:4-alpha-glucanotransferase